MKDLAAYLYELGQLKRVRRSGWWLAGVRDAESVAEHSFRVSLVAYFLAELEGADTGRALAMALFHDAAEARVTDLHRLAQSYLKPQRAEARAFADQTRRLPAPLRARANALWREWKEGATLESRVVRDADRLECLLQAREYAAQGHDVREWIQSSRRELTTRSAKRLAAAAMRAAPAAWREEARKPTRETNARRRGGRA